jgi:hypothetical protein
VGNPPVHKNFGKRMTRDEIISKTLEDMHGEGGLLQPNPNANADDNLGDYEALDVIPALMERLPEGIDIKMCSDFGHFSVTCCSICHTFYAHYDMYLEDRPEGGKAWICCSMRSVLRGDDPGANSEGFLDLERALRGDPEGPASNA